MFVLPPPPRYPITQTTASPSGQTNGQTVLEMSNVLTHPSGPEFQLSVGEGTYILQDNLHLATPPPHPQDAPTVNPNPLATAPIPPKAGIKLTICITNPRKSSLQLYRVNTSTSTGSNLGTYSIKESENESRSSNETNSNGAMTQLPSSNASGRTPVFGEDNILLTPVAGKEGVKRKKPKTNLVKSNSQFISRVIPHDSLNKRLQEHNPEGMFVFANIDRAYQWLDLSSPTPARAQPLMKILFAKAHMLCHDINSLTKGPNHIDVIMGASTGDIVWFEAYSQKYVRVNKNNIISTSAVSQIRWLPGSENLFLAAHMDGSLIVYDKERDDAAFIPESNGAPTLSHNPFDPDLKPLHINKSVNSKNQKANPVASWKISNHRITDFGFSPDSRHLAVVSEDGSLRIINYLKEQLTDLYPSYYGAFNCVCWSPNGKYILTGGQDDLVSIWSLAERRIVARCPGHHSWVTAVAFDPRRCDNGNYRFGSVGEDRRLLLWDFNVGMLRRPKAASIRNRASISSNIPVGRNRTESQATNRFRSNSSLDDDGVDADEFVEHEVESRTVTAELPPVMSKAIDEHPLSWVGFEEECIITACVEGHVRVWKRPQDCLSP
ncbi:hypothetical protein HO173_001562 [Letharia columbiana]|uniref:Catabolite repression protein creC n=1 Tax=Letharia columbiana TaxID=112416 RepID=A0A8H6L8T0_9LECA|nr:uncharacterized protein HO173_001562 [Letharia columbiana]KAF6239954.1 hypothetical protein HO173_001562 [Letharia columbiana]